MTNNLTDIVLLNPGASDMPEDGWNVPTGLATIAALMKREGASVRWRDLQLASGCQLEETRQILEEARPTIVGLSGCTETRFTAFKIAQIARETCPEATIVFGGAHATFTAEDTLAHIPEIDLVVRGEGEETFNEVSQKILGGSKDFTGIKGVSHRVDGAIVHEEERPRIINLSELPWPDYDMIDGSNYIRPMQLVDKLGISTITSRGCPCKCAFCAATFMWGSRYTYREATDVLDEVSMLKDRYNIGGIKIYDSIISLKRSRLETLCQGFVERKLDLIWEAEVRADSVDFELLKLMREAGCYMISIGLESVDTRVLEHINKKITPERVLEVVGWAKQLGFLVKVFLMCANPGETEASANKTLQFREDHADKIDLMPFGPAMIHPGTTLERLARENGCLPADWSWSEPYECKENSILSCGPYDPLFTQPGFGFKEAKRAMYRYYEQEGILPGFGAEFLLNRLRQVESPGELLRLFGTAFKVLSRRIRKSM